ncbi:hypothetical protein AB1Y20_010275 [Prymnesium parvum]|uniref:Uncharacterized protein n=1 Tax=Prymnesium parvum TaxID=97485 RepID=A0AB34K6Q4_PRYPA
MAAGAPNLDVRLTRSQSGNIVDVDFIGGLAHGTVPAPLPTHQMMMQMPGMGPVNSGAVISCGRRLKILEHRVHKVEVRTKEFDEPEEELVVSNLRQLMLKVGVHNHLDQPILDCTLPLRAALLYENGVPVNQTSSSEPLLVGETDVVALQGSATFKLRITSLSSHRDKQRFRIQVTPQAMELLRREPMLCVVTDPMKSVTKLGRANPTPQLLPPAGGDSLAGVPDHLKRKYREALEEHSNMLGNICETQQMILRELTSVHSIAKRAATQDHEGPGASADTAGTCGTDDEELELASAPSALKPEP